MCVHECIYVYMCVHGCICVYMGVYVRTCVNMGVYSCTSVCMCVHTLFFFFAFSGTYPPRDAPPRGAGFLIGQGAPHVNNATHVPAHAPRHAPRARGMCAARDGERQRPKAACERSERARRREPRASRGHRSHASVHGRARGSRCSHVGLRGR
jgi:hypothetical protein